MILRKSAFHILILFAFDIFFGNKLFAQSRGSIWCFGDSSLINFYNPAIPQTGRSKVKSRGSCVSINDTMGNLLFYAFTRATIVGNTTRVYNAQNNIMENGDSLIGQGWYQELIVIPKPNSDSLYYLFGVGVSTSGNSGLYWSLIDMSLNGGLGKVIQKNVLLDGHKSIDCISTIKHGNGRDWWLMFRYWQGLGMFNNKYYKFLISPTGISAPNIQQISVQTQNTFIRNVFNHKGNRLAVIDAGGMIELFDFDRCTGLLSNPIIVTSNITSGNVPLLWSGEFSPNDSLLYVGGSDSIAELVQYNLYAGNIAASADTIAALNYTPYVGGLLKMAPDKKIYWSNASSDNFPYPDTTYNLYNSNLSVINAPDSIGVDCNFQPFSFSLGGARTYYGLPNNPDYDLARDSGSVCDTVWAGINNWQLPISKSELKIFYYSDLQTLFVNAQNLMGRNTLIKIYDIDGRVVFSSSTKTQTYFTQNINCSSFSKGIYVISLITEKESLVSKFIKD